MSLDRRALFKFTLSSLAVAHAAGAALRANEAQAAPADEPIRIDPNPGYPRIACEEAWTTKEIVAAQLKRANSDWAKRQPYVAAMTRGFANNSRLQELLQDLGPGRIANMDRLGIQKQVLMLTAPGVQILDPDTGTALARDANDQMAEAIRKYPDRLAGLTVIAPQDPKRAVMELERGMTQLKLNGAIVNSHIDGEYLDERKYWPILEAAAGLNAPIYIHPTAPPVQMGKDYVSRGLEGALAGFSHDVWLHAMAIITSGAMDEFPNLKICIGHMGEGMPLLMYRFDYMQMLAERPNLRGIPGGTRLKRKISEYMRDNLYITTSGMAWAPAIKFCQDVLGVDHVLYAMDYPYQMDDFEVVATDTAPIPFDHKQKLFHKNAEKLFNLTPAPDTTRRARRT
jgi:predicted TIM-barrel fold metal-dependent hydrolase